MIESLIALTRELGHFPLKADLMMKRRTDPAFPSHNTFRRFGSKSDAAAKVLEYCHAQDGFDDVIPLCEVIVPKVSASHERGPNDDELGFVYLLRSGRYYKIGKTNAHGRRERELAIQLPEKARTVHVIRTDDPTGIETYWHNRFAEKRRNGEWFELDSRDVNMFKRRKFM